MDGDQIFRTYWRTEQSGEIFRWEDVSDRMLWSAIVGSDSVVAVGYKPEKLLDLEGKWEELDIQTYDWQYARAYTLGYVLNELKRLSSHGNIEETDILFYEPKYLPILYLKVADYETLAKVRRLPTVRYLEAYGFDPEIYRGGVLRTGCGNGRDNGLDTSIHTFLVDANNRASWHIGPDGHRVTNAWNNPDCPQGDNIEVAVIDTGVDTDNDQLNAGFDAGQSAGRAINYVNTYFPAIQGNDTDDRCGHGTRIAAMLAHPRGNDGGIVGIAYRADLKVYRTGDDVNLTSSQGTAVVSAFEDAAEDNSVDIISMSMGSALSRPTLEDAVKYAYGHGKLIFLAAGSAAGIGLYPARTCTTESVACTAIQYDEDNPNALDRVSNAAIGNFVDFAVYMQTDNGNGGGKPYAITSKREDGGDFAWSQQTSGATATCAGIAALVWSVEPTLNRSEVQDILIASSTLGVNRDPDYGHGIINAEEAVNEAVARTNAPPPLLVQVMGPTNLTSSGTYTWTASVNGNGAPTSNLRYRWNNGPLTTSSTFSTFITVPTGSTTVDDITVEVIEQGGLNRMASGGITYVAGNLAGGVQI